MRGHITGDTNKRDLRYIYRTLLVFLILFNLVFHIFDMLFQ